MVHTGEHEYCVIGEWDDMDSPGAARTSMRATLDTFRYMLEDQGDDRGVTDPVSRPVVLELK
jgi:hypothetical protein